MIFLVHTAQLCIFQLDFGLMKDLSKSSLRNLGDLLFCIRSLIIFLRCPLIVKALLINKSFKAKVDCQKNYLDILIRNM